MFAFSVHKLINTLFIAGGIGVCILCLLQITSVTQLTKKIREYFRSFFVGIILYISAHLAREIMEGLQGNGVRKALYTVTFIELIFAAMMALAISALVLHISKIEHKIAVRLLLLLNVLFFLHLVIITLSQINGGIYYFDKNNLYYRGPNYLISNLSPLLMLIFDVAVLLYKNKSFEKKAKKAFWIYLIAPMVAVFIQSFSQKIQYIIFATIIASVYMFSVIVKNENEQYEKQKIATSRINAELSMASAIQSDMLPGIFPAFPERKEFEIYATMDPAKEVGGDFYDFFLIDDDHLCMIMADVSGKGVPAALFMMASKIILANNAMMGKSPAQILSDTNNAICSNNREKMFVTVWLGILEISSGKLTASNAGHLYPAINNSGVGYDLFKDKHGLVIGGFAGVKYKDYELSLKPGDRIFVYTDGVIEATNSDKQLFKIENMIKALNIQPDASPEVILKNVRSEIDRFVDCAEQFDDITMLCMQYKGKDEKDEI